LIDPIARGTPPTSQVSQANPISRLENNRANPVIKQSIPANSPAINRGNPDRVANLAGRVVAASPEATILAGKAVRRNKRWRH
jgi:hypothetical protein